MNFMKRCFSKSLTLTKQSALSLNSWKLREEKKLHLGSALFVNDPVKTEIFLLNWHAGGVYTVYPQNYTMACALSSWFTLEIMNESIFFSPHKSIYLQFSEDPA